MPVLHLTAASVRALAYSGASSHVAYRDTELQGFVLLCYKSGKRAWAIDYRIKGRRQTYVIAAAAKLTVSQARDIARDLFARIAAGSDPKEFHDIVSFGEFCEIYMERHSKVRKRSWQDDQRKIDGKLLKRFGSVPLNAISRRDVAAYHQQLRKAPYEANRTVALLSKMFNCAVAWGFLPEAHPNPAKHIDRYPEEERDRWVTPTEMADLLGAIAQSGSIFIRGAVLLYLLTALRKRELLELKWTDVDLEGSQIKIGRSRSKNKKDHYVPLTAPAVAILRAFPKLHDGIYVFPGRRRNRHLVNISKPWNTIRGKAKLLDVRIHDLRRTVSSWLIQSGVSLELIGAVLNHSDPRVTKRVYGHFAKDNIKVALDKYSDVLDAVLSNTSIADVARGQDE